MLLSVSFLFNCTKEVDQGDLVKVIDQMYEVDSGEPFTGKSLLYHDNGEMRNETPYVNGFREGLSKTWYESGKKWWVTEYKKGKAHGNHTSWHENGKKSTQAEFKNDALDGNYKSWHENGKKEYVIEFSEGEFDGSFTSWYENGNKCIQIDEITGGKFNEGLRAPFFIGLIHNLNLRKEPGDLKVFNDFVINGTYKHWYENGELHWKAEFDGGELDGSLKKWSEGGKRIK